MGAAPLLEPCEKNMSLALTTAAHPVLRGVIDLACRLL